MDDALHMAASGMSVVSRMLEASAKNAANSRTPGYLPRVLSTRGFQTALDRELGREASLLHTTEHVSFKQGTMVRSDAPLHVALEGPGFLTVQGADGTHYTRNGSLSLSADGTLVTSGGYAVLGENGPIRADTASGQPVTVGDEGRIYQGQNVIGTLAVTEFDDRNALERSGETFFFAREEAGARPANATSVIPGHLELPPEKSITSMVHMIEASKSFEAQQRVIRTLNRITESLIRGNG